MPNIPIVDAHLHLWDPHRFRMAWLDHNPLLNQPYGLAEYRQQTARIEIAGMVYLQVEVEPPYALLEARWAAGQAAADPRSPRLCPGHRSNTASGRVRSWRR